MVDGNLEALRRYEREIDKIEKAEDNFYKGAKDQLDQIEDLAYFLKREAEDWGIDKDYVIELIMERIK